jgi:sugar phosphate isomerase/epimerase
VEGLEEDDAAYADFHEEFYDRISCFENVVVIEHVRFDPAVASRTQERLLQLAGKCAQLGFTCSTENMRDRSQAQWDILREALSGPVQLTLDAKHAAATDIDPLAYFEFADSIVNIHALDYYAGAPFGDWIPVGAGDIDWRAILARLAEIGYEGPLTVELNERDIRGIVERLSATAILADWSDGCGELLADARLEEMCAIASRRKLEELLAEMD